MICPKLDELETDTLDPTRIEMVSNGTWAGMIAMNLQVHVSCGPCNLMVEVDMNKQPPDGKAIGVAFRCGECGRLGGTIISGPAPRRV
ncbi:hypothetical protein QO002_006194 [Pararhizobium capsulatum DSM 1112]|uniref:Uncharacterized protein n=1 Tax=Pararhizobium capsulatum DSM 1112 TaxID=1121113 RepID=A0ABU0C197_9HYPH|nr:hypothetical protein [Pararhizobium capsulatum]MDQ0323987.1 hypothetical protein [Pararhizobium capsulatum DSM 1112]